MIQQKLKWKDGSRIYYDKDLDNCVRRCVEFSSGHKVKNAGKYYYLKELERFRNNNNKDVIVSIYNDLKAIHAKVTSSYDHNLEKELCNRFSKYGANTPVFFSIIYLAMLDMESSGIKSKWKGKDIVLKSCKAVMLDNMGYEEAAIMFQKKPLSAKEDYYESDDTYNDWPSYEEYGGYNDYDDDTIDIAFEGDPTATWNVD